MRLVGLALFTLCLAGGGTWVLHYAIEGWNEGAISVRGKSGQVIAGVGLSVVALYGFITSLPRRADE